MPLRVPPRKNVGFLPGKGDDGALPGARDQAGGGRVLEVLPQGVRRGLEGQAESASQKRSGEDGSRSSSAPWIRRLEGRLLGRALHHRGQTLPGQLLGVGRGASPGKSRRLLQRHQAVGGGGARDEDEKSQAGLLKRGGIRGGELIIAQLQKKYRTETDLTPVQKKVYFARDACAGQKKSLQFSFK